MATIPYEQWMDLHWRIQAAEEKVKRYLQDYDEFPTDVEKPDVLTWERMHELHIQARRERICRDVMES